MKYEFKASAVIEADSIEDALNKVGGFVGRATRLVANGDSLDGGGLFTVKKVAEATVVTVDLAPTARHSVEESE